MVGTCTRVLSTVALALAVNISSSLTSLTFDLRNGDLTLFRTLFIQLLSTLCQSSVHWPSPLEGGVLLVGGGTADADQRRKWKVPLRASCCQRDGVVRQDFPSEQSKRGFGSANLK